MTTERAGTGDPVVDELIRRGELIPASDPGGVAALLAIMGPCRPATAATPPRSSPSSAPTWL